MVVDQFVLWHFLFRQFMESPACSSEPRFADVRWILESLACSRIEQTSSSYRSSVPNSSPQPLRGSPCVGSMYIYPFSPGDREMLVNLPSPWSVWDRVCDGVPTNFWRAHIVFGQQMLQIAIHIHLVRDSILQTVNCFD